MVEKSLEQLKQERDEARAAYYVAMQTLEAAADDNIAAAYADVTVAVYTVRVADAAYADAHIASDVCAMARVAYATQRETSK